MDLMKTIQISAHGMKAQGHRLRVISENLANADSLPQNPNEQPYRRKMVSFKNVFDRSLDVNKVEVNKVAFDKAEFAKKFMPEHPGADDEGYVLQPNVKSMVEMMDMREAQRSYEANLNVIETTKGMLMKTIDLLRR